jgi:hypothetical protein
MRVWHRLTPVLLLLILPAVCFADIDKDLQKCRQQQSGNARAACFNKLIPRIDELSRKTPGDTTWSEALKEAYGATAQFDKLADADHRIQINAGASKLQSNVLAETNNKAQAYIAVAEYYEALGPDWKEAANRARSLTKSESHDAGDLPPSIKTQIADAVTAVQPKARQVSASAAAAPASSIDLSNQCIKSSTLNDDSDFSGRHLASVTLRNVCPQNLNAYICVKSDRAQCFTCKIVAIASGQEAKGPTSIGFGDCTASTCNGVSVVYNVATDASPQKPNVDDSCQAKTR